MNKINLRVFRRDTDAISLLWDKKKLPVKENKDRISIFISKNDSEDYLADPTFVSQDPGMSAELVIIEHSSNNLKQHDRCKVTVAVDKEEVAALLVFPTGVLPSSEKDDKDKNSHMMLWDESCQMWRKASGIETDQGFALLTVSVCQSCKNKEE